jgi:hypothetical protein
MSKALSTHGSGEVCIKFRSVKLNRRNCLEDLGIDGIIILKCRRLTVRGLGGVDSTDAVLNRDQWRLV